MIILMMIASAIFTGMALAPSLPGPVPNYVCAGAAVFTGLYAIILAMGEVASKFKR